MASPNRLRWYLKDGEKRYVFEPETMLTLGVLRQIKAWYGNELGRYTNFIAAFSELDPEAILCALWICRKAAGEENVPEPNQMGDISLADCMDNEAAAEAITQAVKDADEPTERPTKGDQLIPASTETPTNSEGDTSASSQPSAT